MYCQSNYNFLRSTSKTQRQKSKMNEAAKMKKHCVGCGRKETKGKPIDTHYRCEECRTKFTPINDLNIADVSNLSEISFSDFKQWLTGTIQSALQDEITRYIENFNTEVKIMKEEVDSVKKQLNDAKHKIGEQDLTISTLQKSLDETKSTIANTTKYLINLDRNNRQSNAIIFGIPEDNFSIQQDENNDDQQILTDDKEKVSEILNRVKYNGQFKQFMRLGKKGDKPRPIKVLFNSIADSKKVIANSKELKNLKDVKIYIKPDKTKSETAEFKRIGDRKIELLKKYPIIDPTVASRVKLEKGILTLDGLEVDRYQSIQSLF